MLLVGYLGLIIRDIRKDDLTILDAKSLHTWFDIYGEQIRAVFNAYDGTVLTQCNNSRWFDTLSVQSLE